MQIRSMEYLVALERYGSINKAAAELYISQQGLSKVLDSMEAELGFKLVNRERTGISFTPQGACFLEHAQNLVASYNQAICESRALASSSLAKIQIVLSPYAVMSLFDSIAPRIKTVANASYEEMNNAHILNALAHSDRPQLFIHDWINDSNLDPASLQDDDVVTEIIAQTEFGIVVNVDGKRNSITREEVLDMPLACFGREDYIGVVESALATTSLDNMAIKISDEEVLKRMLLGGGACALIDKLSFKRSSLRKMQLFFVPLDPVVEFSFGASYRLGSPMTSVYRKCIETIRQKGVGLRA